MTIPSPTYKWMEALSVSLATSYRALFEVRALARIPGPAGETGQDGKRGFQGERGEKGDRGEPGSPGKAGAAGAAGVAGLDGTAGKPGEKGERGPPGETGEAGERGERGLPGTDARPWRHRRTYDPAQSYAEGDVVAYDGGSHLALQDKPGPLPGGGWASLTTKGQRGKPGERGPAGPEGRGIVELSINESGTALVVEYTDGVRRELSLVTR